VSSFARFKCDCIVTKFKDYNIIVVIIFNDLVKILEFVIIYIVLFYISLLFVNLFTTILQSFIMLSRYYESHTNKYYSLRIVLHKAIRKKRFVNKIKIIKMT